MCWSLSTIPCHPSLKCFEVTVCVVSSNMCPPLCWPHVDLETAAGLCGGRLIFKLGLCRAPYEVTDPEFTVMFPVGLTCRKWGLVLKWGCVCPPFCSCNTGQCTHTRVRNSIFLRSHRFCGYWGSVCQWRMVHPGSDSAPGLGFNGQSQQRQRSQATKKVPHATKATVASWQLDPGGQHQTFLSCPPPLHPRLRVLAYGLERSMVDQVKTTYTRPTFQVLCRDWSAFPKLLWPNDACAKPSLGGL